MSQSPVTVIKFGSSVLRSDADLNHAVQEVYELCRKGQRVVAVVSAMGNTTESLLDRAQSLGPSPHAIGLAALLATGEATSAGLLTILLNASGLSAASLNPHQLGLATEGSVLDADPLSLNASILNQALERHSVVVVSGFVGVDKEQNLTLLGRGGSDLSAVFIAGAVHAQECILLKDVDGIYDSDPNRQERARRFLTIPWEKAARLGAKVVQSKAIVYAQAARVTIHVTSSVRNEGTRVGDFDSVFAAEVAKVGERLPTRVLLLGLGTVGRGVYDDLLRRKEQFDLRKIFVRNKQKHIAEGIPEHLLTDDARDLWIDSEYDLVVELMGGTQLAGDLVRDALALGVDVVTANKALMASQGSQLRKLALAHDAQLRYSASVGGGVPILEVIDGLVAGGKEITSITGVVNGTSNFVLDRLIGGQDFPSAIKEAQELGFAEADPTLDVDGSDAAQKLALIIERAFGQSVDWKDVEREGITQLDPAALRAWHADQKTVRHIARCSRNGSGIQAEVRPQALPLDHRMARVRNEENIFLIETEDGEVLELCGRGAGRLPTARSIVADILSTLETASHAQPC